MKTLPLFYYPSSWIWVDDDKTLLSAMTEIFSEENRVRSFQSGAKCLAYLKHYQSYLAQQDFLKQDATRPVDIEAILQLRHEAKRHEEITVMVIDYNMPEMNGFELATLTQELKASKILLTGHTPEDVIAEGLHSHLVDRVVQKGEKEMLKKLSSYLQKLSLEYFRVMTAPLLSRLEHDGRLPLSDPTFIDFFETYCRLHQIKEYYLMDRQGSFLCIDHDGAQSCLVVHTHQSIQNWLSIYGSENSLNLADMTAISKYQKIPFFGIHQEAKHVEMKAWPQHFYPSQLLEGREQYVWAVVNITAKSDR